jgi:hypothetical protein
MSKTPWHIDEVQDKIGKTGKIGKIKLAIHIFSTLCQAIADPKTIGLSVQLFYERITVR